MKKDIERKEIQGSEDDDDIKKMKMLNRRKGFWYK